MNRIEITPAGKATTDYEQAVNLQEIAPRSFKKTQDLLVAAKKYAKGGSWFASEKSCLQTMQQEVYMLGRILQDEEWGDRSTNKDERVFSFLNQFARMFPNWQREYEILNKWIPMFYDGM